MSAESGLAGLVEVGSATVQTESGQPQDLIVKTYQARLPCPRPHPLSTPKNRPRPVPGCPALPVALHRPGAFSHRP